LVPDSEVVVPERGVREEHHAPVNLRPLKVCGVVAHNDRGAPVMQLEPVWCWLFLDCCLPYGLDLVGACGDDTRNRAMVLGPVGFLDLPDGGAVGHRPDDDVLDGSLLGAQHLDALEPKLLLNLFAVHLECSATVCELRKNFL